MAICTIVLCLCAATCSQHGVCLTTVSTTATNTAPSIVLRTTAALPATVNVKQYSTYAACASGVPPTTAAPCELGATATDTQDGTLTSVVNSCPPSTCTSTSSCSGKSTQSGFAAHQLGAPWVPQRHMAAAAVIFGCCRMFCLFICRLWDSLL